MLSIATAVRSDMVIGSPIAGRNRAEIEGLLGFFVNTLALRDRPSASQPPFTELVERVQRMALAAYAHQDLPFERLVDELQPERDLSRNPLFQVMFALQNAPSEWAAFPRSRRRATIPVERTVALFDLVLDVWDLDDGLHCVLEYNCELFEAETAARLAKHSAALWEAFAADPEAPIDIPSLLDAAERCADPEPQQWARDRTSGGLLVRRGLRVPGFASCSTASRRWRMAASLDLRRTERAGEPPCSSLARPGCGAECAASASLFRAGSTISSPCSASSRPAAPSCRSTPTYPADRVKYMIEDSAIAVLVTTAARWRGAARRTRCRRI